MARPTNTSAPYERLWGWSTLEPSKTQEHGRLGVLPLDEWQCVIQGGGLEWEILEADAGTSETYRGTSTIRMRLLLGPYSGAVHRALWWSRGGAFLL